MRLFIGALVGGLILFIWQFISWGPGNIHISEMQYTENQNELLDCMAGKLETGTYYLPRVKYDADAETQAAFSENMIGKPWAIVSYREAFDFSFGGNLARGYAIDFVSVLLLCWILLKIPGISFSTTLISSITVGVIGYLNIAYLNHIWFETESIPYLIDAIVGWGLCGAWLGFWLTRENN